MPKKKTTKSMTEAEIKARKEAQKRYVQTLELVSARLPLGTKKQITDLGYNVTQFINEAIASYLSVKKAASAVPLPLEPTKPVESMHNTYEYETNEMENVCDVSENTYGSDEDEGDDTIKEKPSPIIVNEDLSISRSPDWKSTIVSPDELNEFLTKSLEYASILPDAKHFQRFGYGMFQHIWVRTSSNKNRLEITDYGFERDTISDETTDFDNTEDLRFIIKNNFSTFYSEARSLPIQRFSNLSTYELFDYLRFGRDFLKKITFFYKKSGGNKEKFMKSYNLSDLKTHYPICYIDYSDTLDLFYISFFCIDGLVQLNMYKNPDLRLSRVEFSKAMHKLRVTNPLFFLTDGILSLSNMNSPNSQHTKESKHSTMAATHPFRDLSNPEYHPDGWSFGIRQYVMDFKDSKKPPSPTWFTGREETRYLAASPFPKLYDK